MFLRTYTRMLLCYKHKKKKTKTSTDFLDCLDMNISSTIIAWFDQQD